MGKRLVKPPSMVQLGRRVFLTLGLIGLFLVALWLWLSWNTVKNQQLERMGVVAKLVAGQAQSHFDSLGSHLEMLAWQLNNVNVVAHPERGLAALQRFRVKHPELGGASVILPDGQMLISTAHLPGLLLPNVLADPKWREDFYSNLQTRGVSLNRPQFGYLLQKWLLHLRYTVRDGHDKVLFLIQTSIPLDKQQSLWNDLNLQPGAAIGLLREDGYLLSRMPAGEPGKIYGVKVRGALFQAIAQNRNAEGSGFYEGGAVDGVYRIGAYQRLQRSPVYAFISLPQGTSWQLWWQLVHVPFYLIVGLLVVGIVVFGFSTRRFTGRMQAIRQRLGSADLALGPLPSSGVSEIDDLFVSLSDTQQRLKVAAQNREKLLLKAAHAGTYAVRARDRVVLAANQSFLDMLGMEEGEVVGHSWLDLRAEVSLPSATQPLQITDLAQSVLQFRSRNGQALWLSIAEFEQADEKGEVIRHGLAIDVSEREHLLMMVGEQSTRLQVLWRIATSRTRSEGEKVRLMLKLAMDTLDMDVAALSEKVGEHFVPVYLLDTLGLSKLEEVCPFEMLCHHASEGEKSLFVPDLRVSNRPEFEQVAQTFDICAYVGIPIWLDEKFYGMLVFLRRKPLEGGSFTQDDQAFMELIAAWFSQMLLQNTQRQKLETQALTDELTGLPNRRAAELRFEEEIARAKRDGSGFSVATCDLDRFKLINDNYGHGVGDEVLQQVARIMRHALREGDWLARWGGEEFILFLHHSSHADAFAAAERIREAIKAQSLKTSQGKLEITASFGIGVCQAGDEDIDRVISESDNCLYEAKRRGRDCVVVAESGGASSGTRTLWRAGMLQRALKENRVVAAYQVMVDLASGKPVADEALARLVQHDGSVTVANDFIEAAEGINLIHEVDHAITRHAMARCAVNLRAGHDPGFAHFINLSPQFLARKDLVDELLNGAMQFCSTCNIEFPGYKPVVFEVTERHLLTDFDQLRSDLQPLLDFGFRLALDDFGSGYSSFRYLAELPVSFLKIEGWMVRNMVANKRVRAMVESMIVLSQKLEITTIAECIEDLETANMVRDMGVDWGQGYYFGRPEI